jgi:hypothetical protein
LLPQASDEMVNQDKTELPLVLNLMNPFKFNYYAPECPQCGARTCKNCPVTVSKASTLRHLIDRVTHPKRFQGNVHLYKNKDDLKEIMEKDNSDTEQESKDEAPVVKTTSNFGIQDDSDEDKAMSFSGQKAKPDAYAGRHVTLMFELVLVNRIIKHSTQTIISKLLGFEAHPRDKQALGSKKYS